MSSEQHETSEETTVEITVTHTRSGDFVAIGPTISYGVLGTGSTSDAALAAGQAELSRRRAAGDSSLAAIRAQGHVAAALAEARTDSMIREWVSKDGGDADKAARWMARTLRIGSLPECRAMVAAALAR
ncbi:MAG: hypothetical protein Q8P41_31910 [Pseudomonadota bacterium]|nr:hypothetical protein [Pseudomonadota bacterium]